MYPLFVDSSKKCSWQCHKVKFSTRKHAMNKYTIITTIKVETRKASQLEFKIEAIARKVKNITIKLRL